ncbi:DNA/RNA non-specific endonuclease [Azohydromonas caseinilytica]|uniref:Endonuclease n=1 Tax=Azohydromonas caseinilytica TaxID=2728836 RepID=A0A848F6W4_9BURK|nr:DNA/RNA non-specific endonuclease [Azohydromonas caseinilytica]NML14445.1 DNA/RNA non-specific endonuclease [Azohydromonas caseinilytica]
MSLSLASFRPAPSLLLLLSTKRLLPALGLALLGALAQAQGFTQCRGFFPAGTPPRLSATVAQPRELCFAAFATLHSGRTKTPVYTVERLTREQLLDARDEQRTQRFFADARLPSAERATLEDYKGSGFDRGHMAPAADMPTPTAMAQSFSLANIVPQAPRNNQRTWAEIEKATRRYVMRAQGPVYVFTGPVFGARPRSIGEGRVWVPAYLYKLVYDASTRRAWAHWVENSDDARAGPPISYQELVRRTGIEFLPGLQPRA